MSGQKIEPAPFEPHLSVDIKPSTNRPSERTQAASQDSEDGARISDGSSSDAEPGASPLQLRDDQLNGHHDPRQRRIYLSLLGFSIGSALLGLALILVWMLSYRPVTGFGLSSKGHLSNLHVLLMYTFMVSLNMYAVLIYRTHFALPKRQLKWAHAILSGANMIMALLGVAAMYKAHLMGNLANFYSLHSWIGALTNVFYVSQFVFGAIAFLKPGLSATSRQKLMPWHRLVGAALLVLAACAAITGMAELVIFQDKDGAYQNFTPITFIANFAGISVILMTASSVYLLTASHFARPPLAGEPQIKR